MVSSFFSSAILRKAARRLALLVRPQPVTLDESHSIIPQSNSVVIPGRRQRVRAKRGR